MIKYTINKIHSGSLQSCKKCEKQWCNCKLTKEQEEFLDDCVELLTEQKEGKQR